MLKFFLLVVVPVFGFAAIARGIRLKVATLLGRAPLPRFPRELVGRGKRNWVVFTREGDTKVDAVLGQLKQLDPGAHVSVVDASRELVLARAFKVRQTPEVFLTDSKGTVRARLSGGEGIGNYVSRPA